MDRAFLRLGFGFLASAVVALALTGCAPDADGDGFTAASDCDDGDPTVHPGATELCDGVDRNCDGQGDLGAADAVLVYSDGDGDGFGDPATAAWDCGPGPGLVDQSGDCDDADPGVFPGAVTLFADRDGDGFGNDAEPVEACGEPIGTTSVGGDCDDTQDDVFPGAVETCNERDDNCDSVVDEGAVDQLTWYVDGDADGYGESGSAVDACTLAGGTLQAGDCDDADDTVWPGAPETCDGVDDDCDGLVDNGAVDADTWYPDVDADGFGWAGAPLDSCTQPVGFVADATDCNDAAAADFPGAVERCDARDNDCDGTVDGPSATDRTWWYADLDGDGFGEDGSGVLACDPPVDHVGLPFDCDDGDDQIRPLVAEVCDDLVDNDCNGMVDDCGGGGTPVVPWPTSSDDAQVVLTSAPYSSAATLVRTLDRDGDGTDEVAVGGPSAGGSDGRVWLFDGVPQAGDIEVEADTVLSGELFGNDYFGQRMAGLGDLDGDGFDELGVTAPHYSAQSGAFYLWYGDSAPLPSMEATGSDAWARGTQNRGFGEAVGSLGDFDGDGYDDAGLASIGYDNWVTYVNGEGGLYLMYGDPVRLSGEVDETQLPVLVGLPDDALRYGTCIAHGDMDGDGIDDVVMDGDQGSYTARIYFLYGETTRVTGVQQITSAPSLEASGVDPGFGQMNIVPGDVTGDGYPDLVVSNYTDDGAASNGGALWVIPGGAARYAGVGSFGAAWTTRIASLESGALFGHSVDGADLDGDGAVDLIVGAPAADGLQPDSGVVALFTGIGPGDLRMSDATHVLQGAVGAGDFGRQVATGDVDGDGAGDLLVGTGQENDHGRLYYFLGDF